MKYYRARHSDQGSAAQLDSSIPYPLQSVHGLNPIFLHIRTLRYRLKSINIKMVLTFLGKLFTSVRGCISTTVKLSIAIYNVCFLPKQFVNGYSR